MAGESLPHEAWARVAAVPPGVLNSPNFSIIATDARGIIPLFSAGAEHLLGYAAAEVLDRMSPGDLQSPEEVVARAEHLSREMGVRIAPGLEALAYKPSRDVGDTYELTYICKDGSRLPTMVSVTALRDAASEIIGYLLIGTENCARKRFDKFALSS